MTVGTTIGEDHGTTLSDLVIRLQRTGRAEHRDELLVRLDRLLRSRVRRLVTSDRSFEDCYQEARIAAMGALERWRPDGGASVTTFVTRSVDGAVKRYFRDVSWDLHVSRGAKELAVRVRGVQHRYEAEHGRPPTIGELARSAGLDEDDVLTGLVASGAYRAASIDATPAAGGRPMAHQLPAQAHGPEPEVVMDLHHALSQLSAEIRGVLYRYFFWDQTQAEIADAIGCSQMQVSRLLHRGLQRLRGREMTLA